MTPLEFIYRLRVSILHDHSGNRGAPPVGYSYYWEYDDSGPLWKNDELIYALNEARKEYYRIAVAPTRATLPITEGVSRYEVSASFLSILRVLDSSNQPLAKVSHEDIDWNTFPFPSINNSSIYPASAYYEDADQNALYIVGEPSKDDTLSLIVSSLPSSVSWDHRTDDDDAIPAHHYSYLLYWAGHLAFLKRDSDTFNVQAAEQYANLFYRHVGDPISATQEDWNRKLSNRHPRAVAQFF